MKNILINFEKDLIKTALVEDGNLIEILVDQKDAPSCVGNFYSGIVKNILPNQFVFIDIGLEKNAFLYLNDQREKDLFEDGKITVKPGSDLIVQVIKDATLDKGAVVTTQLSVSSNNIVLIKTNENEAGISKKIENMEERRRLKKISKSLLHESYGLILRTSCYGKAQEELEDEITKLIEKLDKILKYGGYSKAPNMIFKEEGYLEKSINIFLSKDIDEIVINDETQYDYVKNVAGKTLISEDKIKIYKGEASLFSEFFVESQFNDAFNKKVWLKSGGFILIEETEACVVIDVNSGKFQGKKDQNKAIMKVNLEAASEIARQLRLRNLSGMIIVDFIDLKHERDKEYLIKYLKDIVKKDRINVNILGMAYSGMVQLTRKKAREPISRLLSQECRCCKGTGVVRKV